MVDQNPPGESTEISWPLDDTTVYATLVRPAGPGPFPAVVMVAGSGPTDRDWNTPLLPGTNGSARLLADALAQAGIASLRYDKRPSGPHMMENMPPLIGRISMKSHLDELAGAVQTIAGQDYIRKDRIFALTNSEGALHALNYQVSNPAMPFAGLVLTAPPGQPVGAVGRAQIAAQLAGLPNGEALMAAYDDAIAHFVADVPFTPDPALPQGAQMLLQGLSTPANLPFARELWQADASALLRQIKFPVLIVIGKKDIQVDWQVDGEALQRAAAGRQDMTFLFPENANHVQKYEPKPRAELTPAEVMTGYNAPDAHLDEEALSGILNWLSAHT
jgi:alpha-beta hydrolase superfamily lysophospholipase